MIGELHDMDDDVPTSSNRSFGLIFAAFFAIVALLPLVSGHAVRWWALAVAAVFALIALLMPAILAPLNRLWFKFGQLLHKIVNPIVLGAMFFLVLTPTGLIMRAFGKDPLRLRLDRTVPSYWIDRQPPGPSPASLRDQF